MWCAGSRSASSRQVMRTYYYYHYCAHLIPLCAPLSPCEREWLILAVHCSLASPPALSAIKHCSVAPSRHTNLSHFLFQMMFSARTLLIRRQSRGTGGCPGRKLLKYNFAVTVRLRSALTHLRNCCC